jgi:hypothetical protein
MGLRTAEAVNAQATGAVRTLTGFEPNAETGARDEVVELTVRDLPKIFRFGAKRYILLATGGGGLILNRC